MTHTHSPSRAPAASLLRNSGSLALCLGLLFSAVALEAQPRQSQEPRIPPLESSESDLNIVKTIENHPELAAAWMPFAGYILRGNSLPARDRELLILRTGYLSGAEYEWGHHVRLARQVGITDEEIQLIVKSPETAGWSSFDRALLRAAGELHRDSYISDRTWAYLDARYDTRQLMDVVFTVGEYKLVSMAVKSFRVRKEAGLESFP